MWYAERRMSVEQLVTLKNEDHDVISCVMMTDETRF
jgi:hypothetical protein